MANAPIPWLEPQAYGLENRESWNHNPTAGPSLAWERNPWPDPTTRAEISTRRSSRRRRAQVQAAATPERTALSQPSDGEGQIVAVIDSGLDFNHPSLQANIWRNPAETADGLDNDGNGLVDDLTGWDFVGADASPQDELGHGTEMAGLVLHEAPAASLMALRVVNQQGTAGGLNVAAAIRYAVKHGADVINLSFCSQQPMAEVPEALQEAMAGGVQVVAAAGNEGGASPLFPANVPGVIAAGASDQRGRPYRWSNGNLGKESSFHWASADGLNTTRLGGGTTLAQGSSAAAALVSGQLMARTRP